MLISEIAAEQTDFNLEDLFEIEDGLTGASKKGTLENFFLTALAKVPVTWIPVTYINSWVDYDADSVTKYYKDILGNVHLTLGCKNGITGNPFTMPEGYRPEYDIYFPVITIFVGATSPYIRFETNGTVTMAGYTNNYVFNGEIIYRAA